MELKPRPEDISGGAMSPFRYFFLNGAKINWTGLPTLGQFNLFPQKHNKNFSSNGKIWHLKLGRLFCNCFLKKTCFISRFRINV
jgi:hypothetical protein